MAGTEASACLFPVAGLRVAIPRGLLLQHLDPAVAEAYEVSLRQLEAFGARLIDHAVDDLVTSMSKATEHGSVASFEGAALHSDWVETETASMVDPRTSRVFSQRLNAPAHVYIRMMRLRAELAVTMNERLSAFDVMALPTTPITAPLAAPLIRDADLADQMELQVLRYPEQQRAPAFETQLQEGGVARVLEEKAFGTVRDYPNVAVSVGDGEGVPVLQGPQGPIDQRCMRLDIMLRDLVRGRRSRRLHFSDSLIQRPAPVADVTGTSRS